MNAIMRAIRAILVLSVIWLPVLAENAEDGTVVTLEDKEKPEPEGFLEPPEEETIEEEDNIVTEISFGADDDPEPVSVYVSPSCLHCGKFIVDELEGFIEENKDKHKFVLKFLPMSAKDIFIMKIIQNEIKDEDGFYLIFKNYIKRCVATIDRIKPNKRQIELFKGSKEDPETIKFQTAASEFGFSDKKIVEAIPDMDGEYEIKLMEFYKAEVENISDVLETKNVNLPLIVKNGKVYDSLRQVFKEQK